jgi:hypothetical protein
VLLGDTKTVLTKYTLSSSEEQANIRPSLEKEERKGGGPGGGETVLKKFKLNSSEELCLKT